MNKNSLRAGQGTLHEDRVARLRMWRHGILLGLLLAIAGSFSSSYAQIENGQIPCGEAELHCRARGVFSSVAAGAESLPGVTAIHTPYNGALIYEDFKALEAKAREHLMRGMQMRESISPYKDDNDFDSHLRNLDFEAGWTAPYGGNTPYPPGLTFQQIVDKVEADLTAARNIYAFLVVFGPEARFRADSVYTASLCAEPEDPNPTDDTNSGQVLDPILDWCNFRARLRQSVREVVNVRIIVGQEFMVDALGLNFSGNFEGGEVMVKKEVALLRAARFQFETAERYLASGLTKTVGNGCLISDFYTQNEWSLLARTSDLQANTQFHIGTRLSYLDMNSAISVKKAKDNSLATFRQGANDNYLNLIALSSAGPNIAKGCDVGEHPAGADVAQMAINLLDMQHRSRELVEGRNIFGFDVSLTPSSPYKSSAAQTCDSNSLVERGLWDQAKCSADIAAGFQEREENKTRQFEESQEKLNAELDKIRNVHDKAIDDVTGCLRSDMASDAEYDHCMDLQITLIGECLIWAGMADDTYDQCRQLDILNKGNDAFTALNELRGIFLEWQGIIATMTNMDARIQQSNDANKEVAKWLITAGVAETVARASQAALDTTGCIDLGDPVSATILNAVCGNVGVLNGIAQTLAGGLSTAADVEIANAENKKETENLLLDQSELAIEAKIAHQAFLAKQSDVEGILGALIRNVNETRRQRAYFAVLPANDPSFRIVRDSARIELALELEKAAKFAYLAARRAEYEYATRLYDSGFSISSIYRARTAQDIIAYLQDLRAITDNLAASSIAATNAIDFKVSIARHVLHLSDASLNPDGTLTPAEIEQARRVEFRKWVAQNTEPNYFEDPHDGKPALVFTMTTSLLSEGLYANVIPQGYDRYWLFTLSGIGLPKPTSNGVSINLLSEEPNMSFRKVVMRQGGLVHMRSHLGCYFDYKLMHPAALLGLEWAKNQKPDEVEHLFNANVNSAHLITENGFRTGGFNGRAISGTGWRIIVFAGSPDNILPDMDLQQLNDIELNLSAIHASRTPGTPNQSECARLDW